MPRHTYRATLADMMVNNAAWYGDHPAYVQGSRSLSFRDYLLRSRKLASALAHAGLRQYDRLGMLGMNSIDYLVMYGACQISGLVAATINFRLADPEWTYIINHGAPKALVFDTRYSARIAEIRPQLKSVQIFVGLGPDCPEWATPWDRFLETGSETAPLPQPEADDLAYLIYTSGTTGRPKGVMLEHTSGVENGRTIGAALQLGHSDRMLLMMPFFHIGAKALELAAQWGSATVHVMAEFDPVEIFKTIAREKITITHLAPTMIQALLDHPERENHDLSSLRTVLYSAAPMPTPVLRRALSAFGPIFIQMYGATEGSGTLLPASSHRPDGDERDIRRLGSIGHPIPGVQMRLEDEQGNEAPEGEIGELCYRGLVMMRGYWNDADATAAALRGGWMHSGDMARRDADGYYYLVDRKKDMIISGGENIYSREVEEAILSHPDISEAAVIGIPDAKWGEAVCAVVVTRAGATVSGDDVIAHCRNH
ncbi:MAG: AMP-binding protein, partial [Rhodobacterales bacterium]|nr:AMP-binding protein [Rhodobacterales bacterium]